MLCTRADMACMLQVILIGVPGAFTPTCSTKHLPGFVEKVDDFKAKGIDTIACTRCVHACAPGACLCAAC